jgi:hypothetical protein
MKLLRFFAAVVGGALAFQAFALPQNDAAPPKRLRIEPKVAAGLLMHGVEPEYPRNGPADHASGQVFLRIVIDRQGKVIEAAPVPRDEWPPNWDFAEDPLLRDAAIQAVKQWEYRPYLVNGQFVEMETRVIVKFKIEPSGGDGVIGGIIGSAPGSSIGGVPGGRPRWQWWRHWRHHWERGATTEGAAATEVESFFGGHGSQPAQACGARVSSHGASR